MSSEDPRDPNRRDPSLFDDPSDENVDKSWGDDESPKPQALFESEFEEEAEGAAQELRYEGPISMDGTEDEYEDESGGGGRLLVTAAIVVGAVIVIVAVAMMMKTGSEQETGAYPEDQVTEVAALGEGESGSDPLESELPRDAGASIDYRAIPDSPAEDTLETPGALAQPEPAERTPVQTARNEPAPAPVEKAPVVTPSAPKVERPKPATASNVTQASGESVGALARDGRVREAAQLGRSRLAASSASHTLQVLYSCEPANVQKAFRNVSDSELTVVPAGTCYRVCFGAFDSHADATAAKGRVPSYFAGAGAFPKPLSELSLR